MPASGHTDRIYRGECGSSIQLAVKPEESTAKGGIVELLRPSLSVSGQTDELSRGCQLVKVNSAAPAVSYDLDYGLIALHNDHTFAILNGSDQRREAGFRCTQRNFHNFAPSSFDRMDCCACQNFVRYQ